MNLDYEYSIIMGKRKFTLASAVGSKFASASSRMGDSIPQFSVLHGMSLVHLIRHHSRDPDHGLVVQYGGGLSCTKLLAPMLFRLRMGD